MNAIHAPVFLIVGLISVALAGIGLFLPLLPTTPFLLLAAACFSRSSRRLHAWLVQQPAFGPMLRDWEESRSIRLSVKWTASVLMVALISYPIVFTDIASVWKVLEGATVATVLIFIWSRPSPRQAPEPARESPGRPPER